jgi:hypothetical protein
MHNSWGSRCHRLAPCGLLEGHRPESPFDPSLLEVLGSINPIEIGVLSRHCLEKDWRILTQVGVFIFKMFEVEQDALDFYECQSLSMGVG